MAFIMSHCEVHWIVKRGVLQNKFIYNTDIITLEKLLKGKCIDINIDIFINPLNAELNPICYLLALLAHDFLHVSRIKVKSLTLRLVMSSIYGVHILGVSRSQTTTQHSR
jgi:hypothetical protein